MSEDLETTLDGEEVAVKEKKKRFRLEGEQEREELRTLLSTKIGRKFYWNLLADCGMFTSSFSGEYSHHAAFAEGKRAIGITYWRKLFEVDPKLYALMQDESKTYKRELNND